MRTLFKIEKLVWKTVPKSAFITFMMALISGIIPAILSGTVAKIIFVVRTKSDFHKLLYFIMVLFLFYIIDALFKAFYTVANNAGIFEILNLNLRADLCCKKSMYPLINFENPKFLDKLHNAETAIDYEEIPMVHHSIIKNFESIVSLVSISILLLSYSYILCILAVITVFPVLINRWIRGGYFNEVRRKESDYKRRCKRIKKYFYTEPFAKEIRAQNAFVYLEEKWANFDLKQRNEVKKYLLDDYFRFELCSLLKTLGFVLSVVLSIYFVNNNLMSIEGVSAAIVSFTILQNIATEFFKTLGNSRYFLKRADILLDFLEKDFKLNVKDENNIKNNTHVNENDYIYRAENLWFYYPEADKPSIEGLNLNLKKGERVAVVGANGSGKTTLMKILLGQFSQSKGELELPEITEFAYVPQKISELKITVMEYLSLGLNGKKDSKELEIKCKNALKELELDLELNTVLGREFGGIQLSGGQWQRLAIAKSMVSDSDIFFYDEATSAIDPIQENYILEKILEITKAKTSVIITHRLAICPYVEKVLILDKGKVSGFGTHTELIKKSDYYRKMYESQSKLYV